MPYRTVATKDCFLRKQNCGDQSGHGNGKIQRRVSLCFDLLTKFGLPLSYYMITSWQVVASRFGDKED